MKAKALCVSIVENHGSRLRCTFFRTNSSCEVQSDLVVLPRSVILVKLDNDNLLKMISKDQDRSKGGESSFSDGKWLNRESVKKEIRGGGDIPTASQLP